MICIIGAGIAGLAASAELRSLGIQHRVFEAKSETGGHCRTNITAGFVFDEGPHVSFTGDKFVKELFEQTVPDFTEKKASIKNYYKGYWISHPVQFHFDELPEPSRSATYDSLDHNRSSCGADNFKSWTENQFGEYFANEFVFSYTRKYWCTDPEHLAVNWIADKMPKPTQEQIKRIRESHGGSGKNHYLTHFRYPNTGGFIQYLGGFPTDTVALSHKLTHLNLKDRMLTFADGSTEVFSHVISSIPLPELARLTTDLPVHLSDSLTSLQHTAVSLTNIGVSGQLTIPETHWAYVYDQDIPFARMSFPHWFSPANVPANHSSIQLESYQKGGETPPAALTRSETENLLKKMGIIGKSNRITYYQTQFVEYANILDMTDTAQRADDLRKFFESHNIHLCGRYGIWKNIWTDQSLQSGRESAIAVAGAQGGSRSQERPLDLST